MLVVVLAYIVLSNVMYKYVYNSTTNYEYYSDSYAEILRQEMKNLNLENQQEVDIYIGDKTELDIYELLKQYDKESWQYKLIPEKAGSYFSEINTYTYKIKDEEALNEANDRYNKFTERLKADDWKSFAREEIETLKLSQEGINETEKDKGTELQIEVLEMRLKYDIAYGKNYKNEALSTYLQSKLTLNELENTNNKTIAGSANSKNSILSILLPMLMLAFFSLFTLTAPFLVLYLILSYMRSLKKVRLVTIY